MGALLMQSWKHAWSSGAHVMKQSKISAHPLEDEVGCSHTNSNWLQ
jgi:hypothetical protein